MKKLLLSTIVAFSALCACNKGADNATASTGDDTVLVVAPLATQEVDNMVDIINSVANALDSIQVQEHMLFNMDEATTKEQVLTKLNAFKKLLADKQQKINELSAQNKALKSNNAAIANLQKVVDYLNAELEQKSKQIASLEEAVQTKNAKISSLRYDVKMLQDESDYLKEQNYQQDKQLNQVFYIVADKKELKALGLLEGGLLSKKRANYANIDQSQFKKADVRGLTKLTIDSKSPKLITEKPASSYTMTKNDDGTSTLEITDSKAFWGASPYLIIQK